jgi:hypothetical protein
MHRKGQVEFIILIGIVVVIAVVLLLALSADTIFPTPVPQSVAQEKKLVEDAVTNVGRQGADIAIKQLEQQGGFIEPNLNNAVAFTNVAVPYWQKCGQTAVPTLAEITDRLEGHVKKYILDDLSDREAYFSKNVSFDFDSSYVSANILKNKIDISVYLPTTIRDYAIPQPYTFSVPTKLGEIHEFGEGFAEENAGNRYLDHFTINTIYFSGDLETQGVLTECGEGIYQSGTEISDGLENVVTYTLTNMLWWQPMPTDNSISKVYSIESLGGNTYEQFDIGLYLPDGFELGPTRPLGVTNVRHSAAVLIFDIPVCFAPYNFRYSVNYPVVVRVKDELTGHFMNFAVQVDVNEMMPGDCSGFVSDPGAEPETGCHARMRVVSRDGPLENATVSFGDNYLGKTGVGGVVEGEIACETGTVIINREGYAFLELEKSYLNINDTYMLYKEPTIELNFRQVDIASRFRTVYSGFMPTEIHLYDVCYINPTANQIILNFTSARGRYGATNIDPDSSDYGCFDTPECEACRINTHDADNCKVCVSSCQIGVFPSTSVDYIPGDFYTVKADMWNFGQLKPAGAFSTTYNLPENNETYYFYVPTGNLLYITENERRSLTNELSGKCRIKPMKTIEHTGIINMVVGCSCGELANMVRSEFSSCINDAEYNNLFSGGCNVNGVKNALLTECGYEVYGCG